ncbi:MAG: flagellar basal body P-ring protein FlgI [Anaerohalosphaeraceae bacterium]|nr:flagellar basal body P-ring protein FlgI [Anaerohalosphaeraceae bacterium]
MKKHNVIIVSVLAALTILACGCEESKKTSKKDASLQQHTTTIDRTIGDLAEFVSAGPIDVKGVGIVVGLPGTGSSQCPPDIREYLTQYILTQLSKADKISPNKMIDGRDTAIVLVEGKILPGSVKPDAFDVTVRAISGTQTTSLKNGRLYTTELKIMTMIDASVATSKTLALAAGAVYIDLLAETSIKPDRGYIINGGRVMQDYQLMLSIIKPDFQTAANIRSRIDERFGKNTAKAASESLVYLKIPKEYKNLKGRFLELVKSLYVTQTRASQEQTIGLLAQKLKTSSGRALAELSLEAIGKPARTALISLLNDPDESTRFSAARTLLSIAEYEGIKTLRDIANDKTSALRVQAIRAIGNYAPRRNAISLINRMIGDDNFDVAHTAYEYLQKFNYPSIIRTPVAQDFYVDQVIQIGRKVVYVSRKERLGIILFGSPIECQRGIYIESDDGTIIINDLAGEKGLSVMRKHPITQTLMGPLRCGYKLVDLIRVLGDEPSESDSDSKPRIGLGVSYSDIVTILKKMCDKGAVKAEFIAGPPPEGL